MSILREFYHHLCSPNKLIESIWRFLIWSIWNSPNVNPKMELKKCSGFTYGMLVFLEILNGKMAFEMLNKEYGILLKQDPHCNLWQGKSHKKWATTINDFNLSSIDHSRWIGRWTRPWTNWSMARTGAIPCMQCPRIHTTVKVYSVLRSTLPTWISPLKTNFLMKVTRNRNPEKQISNFHTNMYKFQLMIVYY